MSPSLLGCLVHVTSEEGDGAGNSAGSTHSMYSLLNMVSMSVPAGSVLANLCLRPSHLALFSLIYASLLFGWTPDWVRFSPSFKVINRMFLLGWVSGTARRFRPYFCGLLFSSDTTGRRTVTRTTTPVGADLSMPAIAHLCLLTSFW